MQYTETTKTQTVSGSVARVDIVNPIPPIIDNLKHPGWTFSTAGYTALFERKLENSKGSRNSWKSWQHYRVVASQDSLGGLQVSKTGFGRYPTCQFHEGSLTLPNAFGSSYYGALGQSNNGLPALYDASLEDGFIPPPADLDNLEVMAYNAMAPTIKPQLSVLNSIYELKDMKSLKRTVLNIKGVFNKISAHLKTSGRYKRPLRDLHRVLADMYLQHMFNLAPLVSDVQHLYTALSRTERRINDLMSRAGRPQTAHFTRAFVEHEDLHQVRDEVVGVDSWEPFWGYQPYDGYPFSFKRQVTRDVFNKPTVFHAQLEYSYEYSQWQREHARVLGILDSIGVNLNPSIIWNAIPYSFLVDWVIGVGQYLDENKVGNMDPVIHIHRYLWSVSRSRTIDVKNFIQFPRSNGSDPWGTKQVVQLPVVTETSYRRQVSSPKVALLRTSGLSFIETSLASALVISRKRRNRPH